MGKRITVSGKLHIYAYEGKKGEYLVAHIDKKPNFVIIKDKKRGEFIKRVNIAKKIPYTLYIGEYDHINDLVII